MKIVYIAPRFHTNQAAMVRGWIAQGDEVHFLVCGEGRSEDHSELTPEVIGYSGTYRAAEKLIQSFPGRSADTLSGFRLRYGRPPAAAIRQRLKELQPDLVILREKNLYSISCWNICRSLQIPAVLYNQSPLYETAEEIRKRQDLAHRFVDSHLPAFRYTPVRYKNGLHREGCTETEAGAVFIPFVADQIAPPAEHPILRGNEIRILEIGKFERRKHHLLMLDAFSVVHQALPGARLCIAGEVSNPRHQQYYEEVQQHVHELHLEGLVTILLNQDRQQMDALYRASDLFVLPSTNEPAAYSHLEAMGYSIPVVVTSCNGTSDYYVTPGRNGEIFEDGSCEDLAGKMLSILQNPEYGRALGANAYADLGVNCRFGRYYEEIQGLLERMRHASV